MIIATQEVKYIERDLELFDEVEVNLDSFIQEFEQGLPNDLNACL